MDEAYVLASEVSQVFYVEDKKKKDCYVVVKTKARDVFNDGSGPLCCDDDIDTYCENIPYNINANNMVSDNIGLAQADVEGTAFDASIIIEKDLQEGDFVDDNDFIDDEFSDEEYNDDKQCNEVILSFELLCYYYYNSDQNMLINCHLSYVWSFVLGHM